MVAGEDDQGVVVGAVILEEVDQAAQVMVELGHEAVVGGAELAHGPVLARMGRRIEALPRPMVAPHEGGVGMALRLGLGRGGAPEGGHLVRLVEGVVGFGGDKGRVRAREAQMQEPRSAALAGDGRHRLIDHEGGVAVLGAVDRRAIARPTLCRPRVVRNGFIDLARACGDLVTLRGQVTQPRFRPGRAGLAARDQLREAGQHAGVAGERRALGMMLPRVGAGVRIADQPRRVSRPARLEGEVGKARVERRAVAHRAVVHHVHAGEQRGAARTAGCALREVVAEQHPLGGEGVETGRLDHGMAQGREAVAAPLVRGDDKNVGQIGHGFVASVLVEGCCTSLGPRRDTSVRGQAGVDRRLGWFLRRCGLINR